MRRFIATYMQINLLLVAIAAHGIYESFFAYTWKEAVPSIVPKLQHFK